MVPSTTNPTTPVQERTFLKLLAKDGVPPYTPAAASGFRYDLPYQDDNGNWIAGEWTPTIERVAPCSSGYHLIRLDHLPYWISTYQDVALYVAEPGETLVAHEIDGSSPKFVTDRVRLLRPVRAWGPVVWRTYAADCAEHVLPIYEARYPGDARPRAAIEAARAYARGEITRKQLREKRGAAVDAVDAANAAYATAACAAAAYAAYAACAAAAYAAYAADAVDAANAAYAADAADAARRQTRAWQARQLARLLDLPWEDA